MCGLAGFVGTGDRTDIERMTAALAHRGPDGQGLWVDPTEALYIGHRRLAVIDIECGSQPMWNADGSIGVIFNGEIYNHQELRSELESKGRQFATDHSDTEVLIHGYAEWAEGLPDRLNGMFAFCIIDRKKGRLFLARDRFGEKPLYYAQQRGLFAFASELTAIVAHRSFQPRLNRRSLQKFLAYGFLPAPNAILEDCQKLPAGCFLVYDFASRNLRVERYWRFKLEPKSDWLARSEDDLADELRERLFNAVNRRLIADVPVGFFLSGGVDSSAVLAVAAKSRPASSLRAFTLGFTEPSYDESEPAAVVARHLGVRHEIDWLDLDAARDQTPSVLGGLDEPSCDASILPTTLLSRFTRKSVTVALSGDGGDELFAGYDPFKALAPAQLYRSLVPRPFHELMKGAVGTLPISSRNMSLDFKLRRTLAGLSHSPNLWNPVWLSPVTPEFMLDLFEDAMSPEELYSEAIETWERGERQTLVEKTLDFYTNYYLQDGILNKVDRATMSCSLESRAIFLDNDLVDFCRNLPQKFKIKDGVRKYLLKKAVAPDLPSEIINRPKKGFGMPTAKWLKSMPTTPPMAPLPGVRMDAVAEAWREHRASKADHRLFLWGWLSLQSLTYLELATS